MRICGPVRLPSAWAISMYRLLGARRVSRHLRYNEAQSPLCGEPGVRDISLWFGRSFDSKEWEMTMVKASVFALLVITSGCTDLKPMEARIADLEGQVNKLQADLAKSSSDPAAANEATQRPPRRLPASRRRLCRSPSRIPQPSTRSTQRLIRCSRGVRRTSQPCSYNSWSVMTFQDLL